MELRECYQEIMIDASDLLDFGTKVKHVLSSNQRHSGTITLSKTWRFPGDALFQVAALAHNCFQTVARVSSNLLRTNEGPEAIVQPWDILCLWCTFLDGSSIP